MTSNGSAEAAALLKSLIAIPSVSRQEDKAAAFLHEKLRGWFPQQVSRSGNNLIVDISGGNAGRTLLLCTHIDTVAVADGWSRDPFGAAQEGERIYGLGANDAGASVVSMIAAARNVGKPAAGKLLLALVAEEEAGDQGFVKIEPSLPRYDAAIFGEPTMMGMAAAMRGNMRVMLHSRGVACHASRPWEGKNATDKFAADLQVLRKIDLTDGSLWRGATIEPTVIRGGESPNQIPALIETMLDIRTTPDKNNAWIEATLKKLGLDFTIIANRRFPMQNDAKAPLVAAVRRAVPQIVDYVFNGGCDMAFAKAPSIVMGPGKSDRSHSADEFIGTGEIAQAIDIYTSVIREYLKPISS